MTKRNPFRRMKRDWRKRNERKRDRRKRRISGSRWNVNRAAVLPSPDMNGQSFGKEIDSHDCVARINTHYLDAADEKNAKFREDFGSKTDLRFANVVPHTLDELNRGDHSMIDKNVKHKILVLRALEEKRLHWVRRPSARKFRTKIRDRPSRRTCIDFWTPTLGGWSRRKSSPTKRQSCSSRYLAPRTSCGRLISRVHDVDETLLRVDDGVRFTRGRRKRQRVEDELLFHVFVQSKTNVGRAFIRFGARLDARRSQMGDYGVQVKTVVDQQKLALRKEEEEAKAAMFAKQEAENRGYDFRATTRR